MCWGRAAAQITRKNCGAHCGSAARQTAVLLQESVVSLPLLAPAKILSISGG